jgi:phage-related protein
MVHERVLTMPRTIDPKKAVKLELASLRPIIWAPQTLRELRSFPKKVKREFGRALQFAQAGDKHPAAKPLKGFGGGGILEIVEDYDRSSHRAVYTVRFKEAVYVIHVFQKKSKKGIETTRADMNLIKERLKWATQNHAKKSG